MILTPNDIFREILPEDHGLSLPRMYVHTQHVTFNGKIVIDMCQELNVVEGCTFQVKKSIWTRKKDASWERSKVPDEDLGEGKGREGKVGIESNEGSITVGDYCLVFPKHPEPCDYVRIVDRHSLAEIAYWCHEQWANAPVEVMGAIIGAMCDGLKK